MSAGELEPGTRFAGRYIVVRVIGGGGMSTVYEVEDTSTRRRRALKLMRAELIESSEARVRFQREAFIAADIESENVVEVVDAGVDVERGRPFIVMELLRGESVARYLQRAGRMPPAEVVNLFGQVARALDKAHARGIVHRDLKPENVIVTESEDGSMRAKILDFGIAKLLAGSDVRDTASLGTPLYLAPEQTDRGGDIRPATDIWQLGLLAFEMLTGHVYWANETVATLYRAILIDPLPSAVSRAGEYGVTLPAAFDTWFFRCVERDIRRRQSSAGVAAAELAGVFSLPVDGRVRPPASQGFPQAGGSGSAKRTKTDLKRGSGGSRFPTPAPGGVAYGGPPPPRPGEYGGSGPPAPSGGGSGPPPPSLDFLRATGASSRGTLLERSPDLNLPHESGPWGPLVTALPPTMRSSRAAIERFLATIGKGVRWERSGLLEVVDRAELDRPCFVCCMADVEKTDPTRVGTATFLNLSRPIEDYLQRLTASRLGGVGDRPRYVFLTIIDSSSLGDGVRAKIVEYRRAYGAQVVPLHVAEIELAHAEGKLDRLFNEELAGLHAPIDPFPVRGSRFEPTRCFGRGDVRTEVATEIAAERTFVVLTGPPGTGKSWLVEAAKRDCLDTEIVTMACRPHVDTPLDELFANLAELLAPAPAQPDDGAKPRGLTLLADAIPRASKAAQEGKKKRIVVLDDADALIELLFRESATKDDRTLIHKFWTLMGELTRAPRLGLIVTAVRGHWLRAARPLDWPNPIAALVRLLPVRSFQLGETAAMLNALAVEANVRFEPRAIEEVHRESAGSPDVARRLCSRTLKIVRARHPSLQSAPRVGRRDVVDAARDLVAEGATFQENVVPWLSAVERNVLYTVSAKRPRDVRALKSRLRGAWEGDVCARTLDDLRAMGFVERRDDKERVSVPLLERWVHRNLDATAREEEEDFEWKIRVIAIGVVITVGIVAASSATHHLDVSPELRAQVDFVYAKLIAIPPFFAVVIAFWKDLTGSLKKVFGGQREEVKKG